jgi:hypothetical protein
MSYLFKRWTITLGAQVRSLHESMSYKDPEKVKRDVETYETELQQLYAYAEQHNIDLLEYYHPFADIEEQLLLIREYLHCG